MILLLSIGAGIRSPRVYGWGQRGHRLICSAARQLVRDPQLKAWLGRNADSLENLCLVPDGAWRRHPGSARRLALASHYFNTDLILRATHTATLEEIPLEYMQLLELSQRALKMPRSLPLRFRSRPSQGSVWTPLEVKCWIGTLWWRVDQLFRACTELAARFTTSKLPQSVANQDSTTSLPKSAVSVSPTSIPSTLPSVSRAAEGVLLSRFGFLGHFVGDCAQPLHLIQHPQGVPSKVSFHSFYERELVKALPEQAVELVVAQSLADMLKEEAQDSFPRTGVLTRMRRLGASVMGDRDKIDALSHRKRKSLLPISPETRTLLISELARGARALAQIWEEAFKEVGEPAFPPLSLPVTDLDQSFIVPDV